MTFPDIQVTCSDYRNFLKDLEQDTVDLILTDPPYQISRETLFHRLGQRGIKRLGISMDFGEWDKHEIDLDALASLGYRSLRPGGTIIVFYDVWKIERLRDALLRAGFRMIRLIIWQKTNPVPLNSKRTYLSNSREVALIGVKGSHPTFHAQYHSGVFSFPIPQHGGNRIHPTQKAPKLFSELLRIHSNEQDLVVDPFLGSGTTAIAALDALRHFKGCDISQHYIQLVQHQLNAYII